MSIESKALAGSKVLNRVDQGINRANATHLMIESQTSQRRQTYSTMHELEIPGLQIGREIGRGGMARVYLATQTSLSRPVALKLLDKPDTPGFHGRFMNEGRYLAALSHSNIVEVYDVGECRGHYYLIMEYLPGGDLKGKIQRGIKPGLALKIAVRIAGCLDYLHEQGIVHRDLKPCNILFRGDNSPVITDFGIAKLLQESGDMTMGGAILGSPSYLSPEQAGFAGEVDGRSDLYSLGVILYEMLTGERPYNGENFAEIIMAHHHHPVPKLPTSLSRYQHIIEHLMAKRPEDRFQTGAEMIRALRQRKTGIDHSLPKTDQQQVAAPEKPAMGEVKTEPLTPATGNKTWLRYLLASLLLMSSSDGWMFNQEVPIMEITGLGSPELFTPSGSEQESEKSPGQKLPRSLEPQIVKSAAKQILDMPTDAKHDVSKQKGLEKTVEKPKVLVKRTTRPQRPVHSRLSKVDKLFSIAYQRMESLKLSYPKGDSAYDYFQKILQIEPDNRAAKAGIRQIVRWYIDHAEQALTEKQIKQAKSYVKRGMNINSSHPRLIALQNQIQNPGSKRDKLQTKVFGLFE